MFTGIIEEVGVVLDAQPGALRVRGERIRYATKLGDSIAVDGVDLTVVACVGADLSFHVMPETYRCTTLGGLRSGSRVNLERSVRLDTRLSGHLVRGVVEGRGRLMGRRADGDALVLEFEAPMELLEQIMPRGPICVDGASLTVTAKGPGSFCVSLVQFTQTHTTLTERAVGDEVNLETDILMRYVFQRLASASIGRGVDRR